MTSTVMFSVSATSLTVVVVVEYYMVSWCAHGFNGGGGVGGAVRGHGQHSHVLRVGDIVDSGGGGILHGQLVCIWF
ncbi:hypothetical protein PR003_g30639 [Phytophthora rubi]|uniref:Uncharacterized protein n=1 Tax=Phytophthora rubi TaxID=129364 RepID=A0A6A4BEA5_9STRA|nr:hypothetical protein PR003_g30639 [Phytophthora rubi]